jgi:hypothetical protein
LTIPATTPSIPATELVRAEVIEISKEVEGNDLSWEVLEPEIDYKIDFIQGRFELLGSAYFGQYASSQIDYPANYVIRASYLHAWYDKGHTVTIPEDIQECVHMIAAKRLFGRIIGKSHIMGLNEFNPKLIEIDDTEIDNIILEYKTLNVGTSPFNKQNIS